MQPFNFFNRIQRINWLQPSVVVLVLANLIPLAGVFIFHWEVFPLLLLFWLENIIIGILNIAKMLLAGVGSPAGQFLSDALKQRLAGTDTTNPEVKDELNVLRSQQLSLADHPIFNWGIKIFLIPFFCVHYGMFTLVHGIFVIELFGHKQHAPGFPTPSMVSQIVHENHLILPLVALAVSHLVSFVQNYLWRGEFRRTNVFAQMTQPYGRIVVMHLTIVFGGMLVMVMNSPVTGLVLLIVLKTAFELSGHQREREKFFAPEIQTTA